MNDKKKVGVIVEVNNLLAKVGVYGLANDSNIIWNGEILSGIKLGAHLTINQGNVRIIATVCSEKVMDQQNTIKSEEFDNRYHKNTVNRIVELKTKGVIVNGVFSITSKYVPMIGNEVTLTTSNELNIMYGLEDHEQCIKIGKTILDYYPVDISINRFFASHIGIFGNTGSGKSNSLHKLYFELFQTGLMKKGKSKFYVIDFNGEYCKKNIFGLKDDDLELLEINTREPKDKIKIKSSYLFDADVLSVLFDARPATQVPFLRKSISKYKLIKELEEFGNLEIGLLISILRMIKGSNNIDNLDNWCAAAKNIGLSDEYLKVFKDVNSNCRYTDQVLKSNDDKVLLKDTQLTNDGKTYFKIEEIRQLLIEKYDEATLIIKFLMFLEFQRVFEILYNTTKSDFINPLFNRIRPALESLDKVVEVTKSKKKFKQMTVISLLNANSQITRLIPMLFAKMIYDDHKYNVSEKGIMETQHLIIDEAHNILNGQNREIGDDWQDYRLSIFEEIIKEGRKFGFYLTLASQRPADISVTIMSQLHNYLIHRLVNEKDLHMLENTMPTLDVNTYRTIPLLGQGETILTGTAFKVPVVAKVDKIEIIRPSSDDVILTDLWK